MWQKCSSGELYKFREDILRESFLKCAFEVIEEWEKNRPDGMKNILRYDRMQVKPIIKFQ